jgi:S-adenosylmethionine decarboxylase
MEDLRNQMGGSAVEHLTIGATVFDSVTELNNGKNFSNSGLATKIKEPVSLQQDSQGSSQSIASSIPQDPQVPVGTHCMLELYGCPNRL